MMWTDKKLEQLEEEEHSLTVEEITAMFLLVGIAKSDIQKELRDFYSKYGTDGVVTYQEARKWVSDKDHRKRMVVLLLFITSRFNDLLGDLEPHFRNFLTETISKESQFFSVDLDVDELLFKDWGVDEANWLDRLQNDVELWHYNISKDVKQSLLKRDSVNSVLEDLNKRFVSVEKVLQRLAITESTAMNSIARREIFKKLGIKKYKFYAREDERTCEYCGALHGLIFPISAYEIGVTASPIHSNCRCWEVPILD